MTIKIMGAMCVVLGCGAFGFIVAGNSHKEMSMLRQLITALEFMECELNYRMTPLPQLFRRTAGISSGCIRKFFLYFAEELSTQPSKSMNMCLSKSLTRCPEIPPLTLRRIKELGKSLGSFDLSGQIRCIQAANAENDRIYKELCQDHKVRIRSYKTLGLCAGAALVIIFI